jgi:excinuclease UvrABC helicase subunit UvrB
MEHNLEYNFIVNQLNTNNQLRGLIQNDIATLSAMIQQKRQWLSQVEQIDDELNLRLNAFNDKDKMLVEHKLSEFK